MTDDYKSKLEAGMQYQDFVADALRKMNPCIILGAYSSRKWQLEKGESMSGVEIKYDRRFRETGNVYIEVAEKSNPKNAEYIPSGIMRNDNTWLYLVGDYQEAFIFSKRQLKKIYLNEASYKSRGIKKKQTPTSVGFTYPVEIALKYDCLLHVNFREEM